MINQDNKIYIGFITYGKSTSKYLPYFLFSLKNQTYKNFKILAVDNSEEESNDNKLFIKTNYPEIEFTWLGENLGFAKAYNKMINGAAKAGVDYFLALNPDMIFEDDFIEKLVDEIKKEEKIGAVAPKILKWDFESHEKKNVIDSYGLSFTREHRFFDKKQGEINRAMDFRSEEAFGFTGAAVLFNPKALKDVAFNNGEYLEYFDELMFMYKEDCDLSYRLRLAGWKIIFAPLAIAYHDRSVAQVGKTDLKIALNRKSKSIQVKKWSFLNQWILLLKIRKLGFSRRVKFASAWYQFKSLIFVLFFEKYLLKELVKLWSIRSEIQKRKEQLKVRVKIKEIEKFME